MRVQLLERFECPRRVPVVGAHERDVRIGARSSREQAALLHARPAPGGPEVQDDGLAAQVGDADPLACGGLDGEDRRGAAEHRRIGHGGVLKSPKEREHENGAEDDRHSPKQDRSPGHARESS